jgi:sugar O-acyltransferase (sialic acid O-acetyltransferase NeuD family)
MKDKQIYLYGAGGHAKVIIDILECCGEMVTGIFDDDPDKTIWNFPNLKFPGPFKFSSDKLILSIGNNLTRKKIAMQIEAEYYTAIHPTAVVSSYASIAEGSVVMGNALINADTIIGKHNIINSHASIDHDCVLENFVHISPNATLCGNVFVGEGAHIGTGAIIIPGKKIGANTIIGAGTVIITDIPDNVTAVGNPARIIKTNKILNKK